MVLFPRKKRYSKISYQKRLQLIRLVQDDQVMIYKAAKRVRIKLATAKVILSNYRKTGKIYHKKNEEVKVPEEEVQESVSEAQSIQAPDQHPEMMTSNQIYWVYMIYPVQNYLL